MTDPKAIVPLTEWIEHHMPYKAKLILFLVIAASLAGLVSYMVNLRSEMLAERQARATLQQDFHSYKDGSAVTKNDLQPARAVQISGQDIFGPDVARDMKGRNAQLDSLNQSIGEIRASVNTLQQNLAQFGKSRNETTGALTGYTLQESRPAGAPPLAAVSISYDPRQPNPALAFQGTTWNHNNEKFEMATGQWQSKKDGGFINTVKLTRTVRTADPNNPGGWITLGTENIPIESGSTIYSPEGIAKGQIAPPKWMILLGAGRTSENGVQVTRPFGMVNYNFTSRVGIAGGVANNGPVAAFSFRLSK